jgi:hypothetical protein
LTGKIACERPRSGPVMSWGAVPGTAGMVIFGEDGGLLMARRCGNRQGSGHKMHGSSKVEPYFPGACVLSLAHFLQVWIQFH